MKGLNLSKFKKLHSNDDTTVLAHPDGHQIRIAHSKLKGELAEQLKALPKFAEGGFVSDAVNSIKKTVHDAFTEEPRKPGHKIEELDPQKASDFSRVFNGSPKPKPAGYAEGGDVEEADPLEPIQAAAPQPTFLDNLTTGMHAENQRMSNPQASDYVMPQDKPENADMSLQAQPTDAYNLNPQQSQRAPQATVPNLTPQNPGQADQIAGIQKEADAQAALGNQEAEAARNRGADMQQMNDMYMQHANNLQNEINNVTQDLRDGHIDASSFFKSQSGLGKVSTAIGLLLGGISAGLNGGENPALKFLNAQIDRDIDAQKMNLHDKNSLLGHLNAQFGNLKDATVMAKAQISDIYASKIAEAAAKSQDPLVHARAQQAIGQIKQAQAQQLQPLAMKQAVFQGLQSGAIKPEEAVSTLVPEKLQKDVFKEITNAQNMTNHQREILENYDAAAKKNTLIQRAGHLGAEPAELTNVRNLLMPVLKDNEGRINETEIKMMEDFLPKAGDKDAKIAIKRRGLEQFIESKKAAPTAAGFGIKLDQIPGYHAAPSAQKNNKAGY